MRKLIVTTFVTLDGVMQAPGGPDEDPTGGFTYGGWSFNYWDDIMGQVMGEYMAKPFELLLGRKTYEIFAAHWPYIKDDPADSKISTTGVIMATYEPVGELKTGSFALDNPGEAEIKRRKRLADESKD